ncbi:polysaccharide pyruvyl transferase WcaK-like protein [Glaciihabitans tibetensis]|uniref:Polysaccharide pyruvyl transferase WcaK-like protein n=1 Tax=Glaciihabitans tibetensis TaxID=1266600 RepID=A0A2T0VIC8_9MICO|nr:polysaccharide pyruvyl transferase family protein [Glaciihabitans tibetensis]PRY69989.1 polysaccharide pyruvyl transferase WcaK-like protein [Glaciihabitans tibetensis]
MRVVCIGDIGVTDDIVHIGDEAMFHEMTQQLRRRGVQEIVAISSNPKESSARYGVTGIHRVGYFTDAARSRSVAEDRMSRVLRTAAGEKNLLEADDTALTIIAAIEHCDAVAIAGGGNLASTWPTHIFERATIGALARHFDKPLVISGQTIGPFLTEPDAALVAELLGSAQLVGLREGDSYALSQRLGVDPALLNQTIDDASFLAIDGADAIDGSDADDRAPYCVVTMAAYINNEDPHLFDQRMAELLDDVVTRCDLDIMFFAHFGSTRPDAAVGDTVVHDRIKARMTSTRVSTCATTDSPAAARLARGAALSVSSRYHPAVFAVSAGVPSVGIAVDDYTTTKLTGALGNFGQDGVLPLAAVLAGTGTEIICRVWSTRVLEDEDRAATIRRNRAASELWWNRVAAALSRATPDPFGS